MVLRSAATTRMATKPGSSESVQGIKVPGIRGSGSQFGFDSRIRTTFHPASSSASVFLLSVSDFVKCQYQPSYSTTVE